MTKLRIFLADDHAVVREGLKALVNAQPDMEVIGEAADGRTAWEKAKDCQPDKEIAAQLNLSVKTVETYKTRLLKKLDLRSRADIVRYALRQGWLQDTTAH